MDFTTGRQNPSLMKHQFSDIPRIDGPGRSKFDRSHKVLTTFDAGKLIPILVDDIVPGDTVQIGTYGFGRLATQLAPVMHNMYVDVHYFFCPYRLLWDNFQKFMGEQANPGDSIDYTMPVVQTNVAGMSNESLFDYMGIPTKVTSVLEANALPFRAYKLIFNEWYRDQNLQNSQNVLTGNGPDPYTGYGLLPRGKRHDYFTSCLPWLQKGDAVDLPLGTSAPITGLGLGQQTYASAGSTPIYETDASAVRNMTGWYVKDAPSGGGQTLLTVEEDASNTTFPDIRADLTNATSATINDLREAFQVQRFLERDARSGTRYIEIIKSHFGVTSPDFRLQRPEYLGGGTTQIGQNPVAQTESSDASTPQGHLTSVGTAQFNGQGFIKSFVEHGVLLGLMSLRADLVYQEGMERFWSNSTRYDLYWPVFAHLGEQPVYNKEIYMDGSANDDLVFGYQERYAHMRYKPSRVCGKFRSNDSSSLDFWHLGQEFGSLPSLNSTFIEEDPPIDRIIATPSEPHMIMDCYLKYDHTRPMPMYSVPGFIDHL